MPLLPLRALPVNDAHDGPLSIRVDVRPSGSAYVYVHRKTDKKTWICKVRSVQEILAPSQQARSVDLVAVVMCLYCGVGYDSFSPHAYSTVPLELRRREVAFSRPDTWTDDGYRLTMRVSIRGTAIAAPVGNAAQDSQQPEAAIPVVDVMDDDVVFGLNFAPTDFNLDHVEPTYGDPKRRSVCLRSIGAAFPNSYLNWTETSKDSSFFKIVCDGVRILMDGNRMHAVHEVEVTVNIVHAKSPVLFELSLNSVAIQPAHSTSYQPYPGGDLIHTIHQHTFRVAARSLLQVVILPGSACALEGSSVTIREPMGRE